MKRKYKTALFVFALFSLTLYCTISLALAANDGKVLVCHRTSSSNNPYNPILIAKGAVAAHVKHGDDICEPTDVCHEVGHCEGLTCVDGPRVPTSNKDCYAFETNSAFEIIGRTAEQYKAINGVFPTYVQRFADNGPDYSPSLWSVFAAINPDCPQFDSRGDNIWVESTPTTFKISNPESVEAGHDSYVWCSGYCPNLKGSGMLNLTTGTFLLP